MGYVLDLKIQRIFLPEEKVKKVMTVEKDLQSVPCSLRHYMSLLGLMTAVILAVQWVRFHQRPLQTFFLKV